MGKSAMPLFLHYRPHEGEQNIMRCPICGQATYTYRVRLHTDPDGAPFTGPEYFVKHDCPYSHKPTGR